METGGQEIGKMGKKENRETAWKRGANGSIVSLNLLIFQNAICILLLKS